MGFRALYDQSWALYRQNPILLVPPLLFLAVSTLASLGAPQPASVPGNASLTNALVALPLLVVTLLVGFVTALGQGGFTARLLVAGRTHMADWGHTLRRAWRPTLGVSVVYLALAVIFLTVSVVVDFLTGVSPPPPLSLGSLLPPVLTGIPQALYVMWLAPIMVDHRPAREALDTGIRAARQRKREFGGFLGLLLVVSFLGGLIAQLPFAGALTGAVAPEAVLSQLLLSVFSPLWYLLGFQLYATSRVLAAQS
jgi:hypothetical protein